MNPIYPSNSHECDPNLTLSSNVGHWISSDNAWLMYDAMNNALSHNEDVDQFFIKASYMVTLICFMYKMKLKMHCPSVNLEG
jgi:hypothetical protein